MTLTLPCHIAYFPDAFAQELGASACTDAFPTDPRIDPRSLRHRQSTLVPNLVSGGVYLLDREGHTAVSIPQPRGGGKEQTHLALPHSRERSWTSLGLARGKLVGPRHLGSLGPSLLSRRMAELPQVGACDIDPQQFEG